MTFLDGTVIDSTAYLAGVIKGDGWCTNNSIGLNVSDKDFADAFNHHMILVFDRFPAVRRHNKHYWTSRSSNTTGRFAVLKHFQARNTLESRSWLRGFFDSEGNADCSPSNSSDGSFNRRISFYNTNVETLETCMLYLASIDLSFRTTLMSKSVGHLGTKDVYQIRIYSSQEQFKRFHFLVGSSIQRKLDSMSKMVESYLPVTARCRAAQLKGAEAKRKKFDALVLPQFLRELRIHIESGLPIKQNRCRRFTGYDGAIARFSFGKLVQIATSGTSNS